MQMYKLNRCLQGSNITVSSIHPGIVETEINRSFSDLGKWKVFFGLSKLVGEFCNLIETLGFLYIIKNQVISVIEITDGWQNEI